MAYIWQYYRHLDCSPFCLDAVISLPLGRPTVITLLAVHLHGSSLTDDKQAADGSEGGGAAAEHQRTWTVVLQLLQSHREAPVNINSWFKPGKNSACSAIQLLWVVTFLNLQSPTDWDPHHNRLHRWHKQAEGRRTRGVLHLDRANSWQRCPPWCCKSLDQLGHKTEDKSAIKKKSN